MRDWKRVPWFRQFVKRMTHALDFGLKKMVAEIPSRKRLRGENEKQKIESLIKEVAVRFFVSKDYLPDWMVGPEIKNRHPDLVHRAVVANAKGVNPLFDGSDVDIMVFWDQLDPIFSRSFFPWRTYTNLFRGSQSGATLPPPPLLLSWSKTKFSIYKPRSRRTPIQVGARISFTKIDGRD